MSFTHTHLIFAILLLSIVHSYSQYTDEPTEDVYFEVLEPSDISYTFRSRPAKGFGTVFDHFLENIYLIPTKPLKACSRLENSFELKGNIAFIERGDCSFVTKTLHAQESGVLGVIVMNDERIEDDDHFVMRDDLTGRDVGIPAIFLRSREGQMILKSIKNNNLVGARINIPLNLTYNDILKEPPVF